MSEQWATPIKKDVNFITNLIFSLKEGYGIWFSHDNITGHQGAHDWISKVVEGNEYVYKCDGDHCNEPYLEKDEDVERFAQEIIKDGSINFYVIQPVQNYIVHRQEPEEDDQELGSYELNGADQPEPQFESKKRGNHMKQELLEYLIRQCAKEVLSQINEGDEEIKGAAAPPADGQGTAETPEIPNQEPEIPRDPSEPETPPASPDLKGIVLVNPKDKAKLQSVMVKNADDATLERSLYKIASPIAGPKVKISLSAMRAVKEAKMNPNSTLYLYVGKYDPNSEENFLMADKSLSVAKDSSVPAEELSGAVSTAIPNSTFEPMTAGAGEFANRVANGGQTQPVEVEENFKKLVKKMINEIMEPK